MISQSVENFLKHLYDLQNGDSWVHTSELAERLKQKPASTTAMIKKLAASDMALVEHMPYHGVRLLPNGEMIALEVIRHHRLIELYLSKALGVPWDKVHDEAEKLEHVISEDLEQRMAEALGHPTVDPHGAPIPGPDLKILHVDSQPLSEIETGETVEVIEVCDHDPELLRYLGKLGLYPEAQFRVLEREEFGNSLTIEMNGTTHSLGENAIPAISVAPVKNPA